MRRDRSLALALLLLLSLSCAAPSRAPNRPPAPAAAAAEAPAVPSAPPAPEALRFGLNTPTASITPLWVAHDEGFFLKHGIDAELVPIPGGERIVAAVVSGDVPLTALASSALLAAALGGADLTFYGSWSNELHYGLYARPDVASVADLRGKQVAVTGRAGINRRAMELALSRNGLDPARDVTYIAAGQSTDALTALLTGAVSATMLTPPTSFRAEDEGMRLLVDTEAYHYPTILSGIAGSRAWVDQHEDLVRRALEAVAEGVAFARQNKERTKAIIGQWTQSDDADLLERTYVATRPSWEESLRAPPEALRNDLDALADEVPTAREASAEQFVDNRFVDALEREGFFARLYR
ncbi:MAG TPA: ABC transporter substrate-binding protein [Chloroflexota bacterium]|nr:ABC transporter substrate-binding protein [Chloroflexota bacterium]